MKQPYFPFYTGDWLKDPRLSLCSPTTRGVWIDLICAMHEFDRSGELRGTSEELARLARCSTVELEVALTDLQNKRAADVIQRNGSWIIANRRMKREADIRAKRQQSGSKGGSKAKANREQIPEYESEDEGVLKVRGFAKGEGIAETDADWFFWKCVGNGWTNGGKPIHDWKATLRCWYRAGWLPSQKNGNGNGRVVRSAWDIQKRVEAITQEINATFKKNGGRVEGDGIDELKKRRDDLQKQLLV